MTRLRALVCRGFSNTLSLGRPAKYLTCADCEQDVRRRSASSVLAESFLTIIIVGQWPRVQVLGVHYLDETKLYVAASRVDYA